jgi:hypothetical protein
MILKLSKQAVQDTSLLLPECKGWLGPTKAYKQATIDLMFNSDHNADEFLPRQEEVFY